MAQKTVTLHCQAGDHEWERPSQRGKRPANCPEHTEIRVPKVVGPKTDDTLMREAQRMLDEGEFTQGPIRDAEGSLVDFDSARRVKFALQEIRRGIEPGDERIMREVIDGLMKGHGVL